MRKLDIFSQRILAVGVSMTMVLLAATLLFQSAPFAKADPFPAKLDSESVEQWKSDGIQAIGKYKMEYQLIYDPDGGDFSHFVLIYDTETANSRIYYRDGSEYLPSGGQLPPNPL